MSRRTRLAWLAFGVAVATAAGTVGAGCASDRFALDLTVSLGDLPPPALLSIAATSLRGDRPLATTALLVTQADLLADPAATYRVIVVPAPDADALEIVASAYDDKHGLVAAGTLTVPREGDLVMRAVLLESVVACGDGVVDAGEQCDGAELAGTDCALRGFPGGGVLACGADCRYDESACLPLTACGDGVATGDGEECDGTDLAGRACADLGCTGGTLACAPDCLLDLAACTGC